MLFYQTIEPEVLDLLKAIQQKPVFQKLYLVGGTGLALLIGHRKSIDLDFFGKIETDKWKIKEELQSLGNLKTLKFSDRIFSLIINGIKVDMVHYSYDWIDNPIEKDGIRIAGMKDIAAMKLLAITNRGTKKDFVDIFFLMKRYTPDELLSFFEKKYPDADIFGLLRSLTYFEDAENDIMPEMLEKVQWNDIKQYFISEVHKYIRQSGIL